MWRNLNYLNTRKNKKMAMISKKVLLVTKNEKNPFFMEWNRIIYWNSGQNISNML